jgi:sugar lactone lactonase YvrE
MMQPEVVADHQCITGEGPLWHPVEKRLYWVDIPRGRLLRYDPAARSSEVFELGIPIGGLTLQADGDLLLFMARGAVQRWRKGTLTPVVADIPYEADNRFNDVIADPEGRVFCGTMTSPTHPGRLYRLDRDASLTVLLDGIGTSNGLGFTPDHGGLYYTDTGRLVIYRFDYDRATGAISNQRVFARVPETAGEGKPDGLTVDAEGCVWSARWDGGCVVRYAPDGGEILRIPFPARRVSCIAFGGDDCRDLYVTTAGGDRRAENGPAAGALFVLRPGVQGVPEFVSRVGI